ncbi:rRNA-processing protein and EBNA1-binding protein ebp2, partial [Gonapodya sp. JEL0774]
IPFIETLSITNPTPLALEPSAASDDLRRELSFYEQALQTATTALAKLRDLGIPTTRPVDYFAEMVKTDTHMLKVKSRIAEESSAIKRSEDAKRQRTEKKLGKKIQIQREQQKKEAKEREQDKLKHLKRKRGGGGMDGVSSGGGGEDFGVSADADMDDDSAAAPARKKMRPGSGPPTPSKRALAKHAKYTNKTSGPKHGSGRFEKQGKGSGGFGGDDGDRGKGKGGKGSFSVKKMKSGFGKGGGSRGGKGAKRPGKDARQKSRKGGR